MTTNASLTGETVELLQALIRNACVNDGTPASGQEVRNARLLADFLEPSGVAFQTYEPTPGRTSLVARIEGSDPTAPSLCLMGHTDVVPVNAAGWSRDPFGGELVDNEIWGRGAVDMLNLTASMAVVFRHLAIEGFRPKGDLIYFAVADEEAGSTHGMRWMADNERDAIYADYVLTESGGLQSGPADAPYIGINVAEKGVAWRRIRVHGTPGHGSAPFKADNALVAAASVIQRLHDYRPAPDFHGLWPARVESLDLDSDTKVRLLDLDSIDSLLDDMPVASGAAQFHACTHTTFSCNLIEGGGPSPMKVNVIPDNVYIGVDIRTLPGETHQEVDEHLRAALGDLYDRVDIEILMNDPASMSRIDTPLWDCLQRSVKNQVRSARLAPQFNVGFTDCRIYREMGSVSYGAGLLSSGITPAELAGRFHGNDERIDIDSLGMTTQLWADVTRDLLGW